MATVLRAIIVSLLLAIMISACNGNESAVAPAEQLDQEPSHIAAQVTLDGEQLDEFADFIEQERLDSEIPGVAATIVQGEEIILAKGFGVRDVNGDEPITPETLFHIGSTYIGVLAAGGDPDRLYEGYVQSLQERIFDPIGMPTATLSVEAAQANPNHSASHIFDDDGDVISVESYDFSGDPLAPSGSIKASVLDMAEYMSTQVRRGLALNGTRVVSAENLTETWRPQIEDDESGGA